MATLEAPRAQSEVELKLEKPGAGLPFVERMMLRYYIVPKWSQKEPWEKVASRFEKEGSRILGLVSQLSDAQLSTRALIDRLPGLEDSSRYWSVAMTLDHLMIVGRGIGGIVIELSQGRSPGIQVDIAKIKPKAESSERPASLILNEFREFLKTHLTGIKEGLGEVNLNRKVKHVHPWFGKLNARQWFWVMAGHQQLHRRQIERIISQITK